MEVVTNLDSLSEALARFDQTGSSTAFVPTMGNLHAGHILLIERGLALADIVVASIFVNPMQFGPNEDLDAYPRTLQADIDKLKAAGTALLFAPSPDCIYPDGVSAHTQVIVPGLTDVLCGASRPGHFDGVSSIVCKLLHMVKPDIAIFGEKDLQQLLVIRKMVADLCLPVRIEGVATARDADGLALSSRNGYLSDMERSIAPGLQRCLQKCAEQIRNGAENFTTLSQEAKNSLQASGFRPDYFEIRRSSDLQIARPGDTTIAIFAAAQLGSTRLIDNLQLVLSDG